LFEIIHNTHKKIKDSIERRNDKNANGENNVIEKFSYFCYEAEFYVYTIKQKIDI